MRSPAVARRDTAVVDRGLQAYMSKVYALMTGAMLPRGADAVVMVEHTEVEGDRLLVRRAVTADADREDLIRAQVHRRADRRRHHPAAG